MNKKKIFFPGDLIKKIEKQQFLSLLLLYVLNLLQGISVFETVFNILDSGLLFLQTYRSHLVEPDTDNGDPGNFSQAR